MNVASTKVIRPAWEAAWECLRGWSAWTQKIQTFVAEDDPIHHFNQTGASASDMPLVSAAWDQSEPRWWVYSHQLWELPLRVSVFVPSDRWSLGMDLVEDAVDALFRFEASGSTAAAPVPLLKKLSGGPEPKIVLIQPNIVVPIGDNGAVTVLRSDAVVQIVMKKDPKIRGS